MNVHYLYYDLSCNQCKCIENTTYAAILFCVLVRRKINTYSVRPSNLSLSHGVQRVGCVFLFHFYKPELQLAARATELFPLAACCLQCSLVFKLMEIASSAFFISSAFLISYLFRGETASSPLNYVSMLKRGRARSSGRRATSLETGWQLLPYSPKTSETVVKLTFYFHL